MKYEIVIRKPKEPTVRIQRGKWIYVYDAENVCLGVQLAEFSNNSINDNNYKNSIVVLPKEECNETSR